MPQMTLYAPDITCDHCINTIRKAVTAVEGARFVSGDPEAKTFVVDVASGAVLDRVAEATAAEGYPLGDAPAPGANAAPLPMAGGMHAMGGMHGGSRSGPFHPNYSKVERTEAGADVTYSCPCGSTTEVFHLDRSRADQPPHSCCGHHTLVGANAAERLRARLGAQADAYDIDVQTLTMPWGQPLEAAQAVPKA